MKSILKKLFRDTSLYLWLRGKWYAHLKEIPRKRLRKHGPAALKIVYEALKDSQARYFADFGTLLGIQREHDFIRHDDDIDYSVIAGSISPAELYKLLSKRLQFSHAFEYCGLITEMTFLYKKIEIDFFFTYSHGGELLSPECQPKDGPYSRAFGSHWQAIASLRSTIIDISVVPFKGTFVPIPSTAPQQLRELYGSWETPVEGWQNTGDFGQRPKIRLKGFSTVVDKERILGIGNETTNVLTYDPE